MARHNVEAVEFPSHPAVPSRVVRQTFPQQEHEGGQSIVQKQTLKHFARRERRGDTENTKKLLLLQFSAFSVIPWRPLR
jgi:hypothetical protein